MFPYFMKTSILCVYIYRVTNLDFVFYLEGVDDEVLSLLLVQPPHVDETELFGPLLHTRPVRDTLYLSVLLYLRQVNYHSSLMDGVVFENLHLSGDPRESRAALGYR